jgi:hypothetical protein
MTVRELGLMGTSAIDAARDYINDAIGRGVGAVSTAAVAKRLNVTEDQAIALLNCLVETESLVSKPAIKRNDRAEEIRLATRWGK